MQLQHGLHLRNMILLGWKEFRGGCSFCYEQLLAYSSVSAMITLLNWLTLGQRRNYLKLVMLHKITRGFAEIPSLA